MRYIDPDQIDQKSIDQKRINKIMDIQNIKNRIDRIKNQSDQLIKFFDDKLDQLNQDQIDHLIKIISDKSLSKDQKLDMIIQDQLSSIHPDQDQIIYELDIIIDLMDIINNILYYDLKIYKDYFKIKLDDLSKKIIDQD